MRQTMFLFVALLLIAGCDEHPMVGADGGPDDTRDSGGSDSLDGALPDGGVTETDGGSAGPLRAEDIRVVPARSSVRLYLPAIEGAGDYRVYAEDDSVTVREVDGRVQVDGATIYCAGLVQSAHCDNAEAADYGFPRLNVPTCDSDPRAIHVDRTVSRVVEVDGLVGPTTLVVEAVDALCPFTGVLGRAAGSVPCVMGGSRVEPAEFEGAAVNWELCPESMPIRTEESIRAEYGSLIINGQGSPPPPALGPAENQSPYSNVGLPAPAEAPHVLARTTISVTPLGFDTLPSGFTADDFFEDFQDSSDQPVEVLGVPFPSDVYLPRLYETSNLAIYSIRAESASQLFLQHGTMRSVLADVGNEPMASHMMYPRRAFSVQDDSYLHLTVQTQTNASARRYEFLAFCGAEEAGGTIVDGRLPDGHVIDPLPFFMSERVGRNISHDGWNCISLVNRDGGYEPTPGGPEGASVRAQSDVRVIINPAGSSDAGSTVNVSPTQGAQGATWARTWNDAHELTGVMLDDERFIEARTRFDVYLSRSRIVVYLNGRQALCNDFPSQRLTMAEAAVGVGNVLYHSSAERTDLVRTDWLHSGQYYWRHNTPLIDHRSFDEFGVQEGAALPSDFSEAQCYLYE